MSEKSSGEYPQATVREVDGRLILDDPQGLALARAVEKHNCEATLEMNEDRVAYFKQRATERGFAPDDVVITVINVDDAHGAVLAEALMPGFDWQTIRDRGEVPFARGLADRTAIQTFLEIVDQEAAAKLHEASELSVVVVDHSVAEIFEA